MLSDDMFQRWCETLGLAEPARAVVVGIRAAPPARRVRGGAGNVCGRYPSRKMGVTIQFESHTNELAAIYAMEHDPAVLEYYDQPPRIKLAYHAKGGRRVGHLHTADFFVLRAASAGWEEWKAEAALPQLAVASPQRYRRGEGGGWQCPPGEAYAAAFGLTYTVRSSAGIDWVYQRNLRFLEDYLRDAAAPDAAVAAALTGRVAEEPGIALDLLLREAAPGVADALYALIATGALHVDLRAAPLAEPDRVRVFRDREIAHACGLVATALRAPFAALGLPTLAAGTGLIWDGQAWTLLNAGETATTLLDATGGLVELPRATFHALVGQGRLVAAATPAEAPGLAAARLRRASPADLAEANRRHAAIAAALTGAPPRVGDGQSVPARTRRAWLARYRAAEGAHGCGYVGLLPDRAARGNRTRKLPEPTRALMARFIAEDYETLKQKRRAAVYGALVRACDEAGTVAPSYKTFARAVNHRPQYEQTTKRRGGRAAYPHEPWHWELTPTTPRHGDRPFEIAHLDHTELDVELVCSRTGRPLGRPWATFLSDAYSRRLLAVALAFDPPSYRACLLAIRECVRRHARLPQALVVDGGAEFGSAYFETLLARYEVTKKERPGAKPRFGAVCERLFGTANTQFIHNLSGNTQLTVAVRQVTAATDPRNQACWTLGALHARLCEWAYEVYDTRPHPALGQSPREAFAAGLARGGRRPQRRIADDETFRLLTLPTTRKGTARVVPGRGVKIRYLYYRHETFRHPEVEQARVPVRYDPFDAGIAYAFAQGHWVQCTSEQYLAFQGRSEREIQLATAELRRRHQGQARQFAITAKQLAAFLAAVEGQEALLGQRLKDAEARPGAGGAPDAGPPPGAPTVGAVSGAERDHGAADDAADYEEYR